jgi:tetratricopeptide (TPR) repeat protein
VRNFERATELDPRNVLLLTHLAATDCFLRDYQQASDVMDRILVLNPNDLSTKKDRAGLAISWRADVRPLRAFLEKVLADDPAQAENDALKGARFYVALFERDFDAAGRVAETLPEKNSFNGDFEHGRPFYIGLVARMRGDAAGATAAFTAARAQEEAEARARPNFGSILSGVALVDAALGRKEEALREGRRAVELTTRAKDLLTGPEVVANLALIYAWTGERDLAIKQLEIAAKLPNGPDYGDLVLDPVWDSLRADPRFQKIVASLAPKK